MFQSSSESDLAPKSAQVFFWLTLTAPLTIVTCVPFMPLFLRCRYSYVILALCVTRRRLEYLLLFGLAFTLGTTQSMPLTLSHGLAKHAAELAGRLWLNLSSCADATAKREPLDSAGLVLALVCQDGAAGAGFAAVLFEDARERAILLRIGGPHPQTAIFQAAGPRLWLANFSMCDRGNYTAHVRLVMVDPWATGAKAWSSCAIHHTAQAALVPQFNFRPDRGPAQGCTSSCLWSWRRKAVWQFPNPTPSYVLPLSAGEALHSLRNISTTAPHPWAKELPLRFSALEYPVGDVAVKSRQWPRLAAAIAARGTLPLCLVGDSHLRTLANRLIQLLDPWKRLCDPLSAQETHAACESADVLYFGDTFGVKACES